MSTMSQKFDVMAEMTYCLQDKVSELQKEIVALRREIAEAKELSAKRVQEECK